MQKPFAFVANTIIFTYNYIPPTVADGSIEGCPVGTGTGKLGIEICWSSEFEIE